MKKNFLRHVVFFVLLVFSVVACAQGQPFEFRVHLAGGVTNNLNYHDFIQRLRLSFLSQNLQTIDVDMFETGYPPGAGNPYITLTFNLNVNSPNYGALYLISIRNQHNRNGPAFPTPTQHDFRFEINYQNLLPHFEAAYNANPPPGQSLDPQLTSYLAVMTAEAARFQSIEDRVNMIMGGQDQHLGIIGRDTEIRCMVTSWVRIGHYGVTQNHRDPLLTPYTPGAGRVANMYIRGTRGSYYAVGITQEIFDRFISQLRGAMNLPGNVEL